MSSIPTDTIEVTNTVGSGITPPSPVRRFARWIVTPAGVHYVFLVVLVIFQLVIASMLHFWRDDWAFVLPSTKDIWAAHNGHWSTTPILIFWGLRAVFGLNLYFPFVIPVIIAHTATVNVLWRICRRIGVLPWIGTATSALIGLMTAGDEDIDWAFQVGFLGAIVLGLIVLLILSQEKLRTADLVLIIVLATWALTFSSTAIPVLLGAFIVGWVRHGLRRTILLFIIPAVAYAIWFLSIGIASPPDGRATGIYQILFKVPGYALHMLADGFSEILPVLYVGQVIFCVVLVWAAFMLRRRGKEWVAAYGLVVAVIAFALLTGYERLNLGMVGALSSRYLYLVIGLLLPVAALAFSELVRRFSVSALVAALTIVIITYFNGAGLVQSMLDRAVASRAQDARVTGVLALIKANPGLFPSTAIPLPDYLAQTTIADYKGMLDNGWLKPGTADLSFKLTELAIMKLAVKPAASTSSSTAGCTTFTAVSLPVTLKADQTRIVAHAAGGIQLTLASGSIRGQAQPFQFKAGVSRIVNSSGERIIIGSTSQTISVCAGG